MKPFFNDYFNIAKMIKNKQEYRNQMKRVKKLPEDYQYVFKKIQTHMWQFVSGAGYDMMEAQCSLLELFEEGALNGKSVLEVTGEDVASFVEELLKNTRTYTEDWKTKLNCEISKRIKSGQNKMDPRSRSARQFH